MSLVPNEVEGLEGDLASAQEPPAWRGTVWVRGRRVLQILLNFFLGQGAVQAVSLLAGLFLVRRLSVEAYAQFGLATGFQSVVAVLMDFGFASTIIPLVGERRDDRALIGRYVRSAKHLRDRAFLLLAPVAIVVFLAIMHQHHWGRKVQVLLIASVLLALYSGGKVSYYSAPLFMYGRLRDYYVPQVVSGTGRLVAYLCLGFTGGLNAWTAAGLSAVNVTVNGGLLERKSRPFLEWPKAESPATDREVLRYVLPAAPAVLFAAFQSQISLFLISIFGGTIDMAQVAALNRIGQLFSVLMMFNVIVVEPYMARLNRRRLLRTFVGLLLLAALACAPVVLLAFAYPQAFLWLLGSKYAGLRGDIGWLVLASCLNYLAGLMWIMNRARKWLFWSGTAVEIVLLLATQTAFVAYVGVRTVREAVLFTFASSLCYLIAHGYVSVYGFVRGPRAVESAPEEAGVL
ncbi:MAG: hypothetical protein NVSMB3_01970 [Acidobacteriaceae bacterium]